MTKLWDLRRLAEVARDDDYSETFCAELCREVIAYYHEVEARERRRQDWA